MTNYSVAQNRPWRQRSRQAALIGERGMMKGVGPMRRDRSKKLLKTLTRNQPEQQQQQQPEQLRQPEQKQQQQQQIQLQQQQQQDEHDRVFYNLMLREQRFEEAQADLRSQCEPPALCGQLRHSLLSWMLRVCEHQLCQDEIFPLATIILDNFLLVNPIVTTLSHQNQHHHRHQHQLLSSQRELEQRQLLLFAACSLLLATKLRQTPRLYIQTLIEFSRLKLPIELGRGEIIDGELLMLSMLKWDLAALVTPNEFLQELLARKCKRVVMNFLDHTPDDDDNDSDNNSNTDKHSAANDNGTNGEAVVYNQCNNQHQHSDTTDNNNNSNNKCNKWWIESIGIRRHC